MENQNPNSKDNSEKDAKQTPTKLGRSKSCSKFIPVKGTERLVAPFGLHDLDEIDHIQACLKEDMQDRFCANFKSETESSQLHKDRKDDQDQRYQQEQRYYGGGIPYAKHAQTPHASSQPNLWQDPKSKASDSMSNYTNNQETKKSHYQTQNQDTDKNTNRPTTTQERPNSKFMFEIVERVEKFQFGTYNYYKVNHDRSGKINKRFVPFFPFLYDEIGNGRKLANCQFQMPHPPKFSNLQTLVVNEKQYEDEEQKENPSTYDQNAIIDKEMPFKCNMRLQIDGDPLFIHEESRYNKVQSHKNIMATELPKPVYIIDLEFQNIKKIVIQISDIQTEKDKNSRSNLDDMVKVRYFISLDKPANCQKLYPFNQTKPNFVRSPFKMPFEHYIQYWNLHQTLYIQGYTTRRTINRFINIVQTRNSFAKIKPVQRVPDHHDHMQGFVIKLLKEILQRNKNFKIILDKLRLPLVFSIMAMLSNDKVNLFNDRLYELMEYFVISEHNQDENSAQFASFVLDKIIITDPLDYKKDPDINFIQVFQKYLKDPDILHDFKRSTKNVNFLRQRRLFITPTLDYYQPAYEDETNRVIRQYRDHLSRFVRVSFVNEYLEKGYYFSDQMNWLLGYLHHVLVNGIQLGNYVLKFLSYSNSQIKNHSCWMLVESLVPNKDFDFPLNENIIMRSMGDFSQEKNMLKRYARRGQCFSTTKFILQLDKSEVTYNLPDVKRNGFIFTDGCGYISPELAQLIAEQFSFKRSSAFQIRFGGTKGVLMLNPRLEGRQIQLRDSQIKFQSNDLGLNVVRCGTYSQGFLNRQIIILMNCLGVPESVFLELQRKAKEYAQVQEIYNNLIKKTSKAIKAFKLSQNKSKSLQQITKLINLSLGPSKWFEQSLKTALLCGYNIPNDPIFSSILYTMQLSSFMNLKKKARIIIPDSCVLLGIVDEFGILEEDEVFIQVKQDNYSLKKKPWLWDINLNNQEELEKDSKPLQICQDVIVTRNPCTHPGDIRLLKAVNKPELSHLFNVVVFSSKGERPQCNKMAGGDLDGDVYFVCWDSLILSHIKKENIQEPATYVKPTLISEQPIDSEHIADYFIFYLQRDVLGKLANMHLALCDQIGVDGPLKEECQELSALQSIAVDFAKHGESVDKKNFEHLQKMLDNWPDFFEKSNQKMRVSEGVLGMLYRDINNDNALKDFMKNQYKFQILYQYELNPDILAKCENPMLLHFYVVKVFDQIVKPMEKNFRQLMITFKLQTESQLFAADLKFKLCDDQIGNFYKNDPGYKSDESLIILNNKLSQIVKKFQEKLSILGEESKQKQFDISADENLAVALYFATYFHIRNKSCQAYLKKHANDEHLSQFRKQWEAYEKEKLDKVRDQTKAKIEESFESYMDYSKYIENQDARKLQQFLELKKFYSFPWILASEQLFSKRDFLVHVNKVEKAQSAKRSGVVGSGNPSASKLPAQVVQTIAEFAATSDYSKNQQ